MENDPFWSPKAEVSHDKSSHTAPPWRTTKPPCKMAGLFPIPAVGINYPLLIN